MQVTHLDKFPSKECHRSLYYLNPMQIAWKNVQFYSISLTFTRKWSMKRYPKPFNQKTHQLLLQSWRYLGFKLPAQPVSRSTQSATLVTSSSGGFLKAKMRMFFCWKPPTSNQKKSWKILESSTSFILVHIKRLLHDLFCIFLCQLRDLGAGMSETSTFKAGKSEELYCKLIPAWLKTREKKNTSQKKHRRNGSLLCF